MRIQISPWSFADLSCETIYRSTCLFPEFVVTCKGQQSHSVLAISAEVGIDLAKNECICVKQSSKKRVETFTV